METKGKECNILKCFVCGSTKVEKEEESEESLQMPYGSVESYKVVNYNCSECEESGDFTRENDERIEDAIRKSNATAVSRMVGALEESGISMAYLGRVFDLDHDTVHRFRNRDVCTGAEMALLRVSVSCPYVITVFDDQNRRGFWMEIKSREDLERSFNRLDEIWDARPGDVDFKERNMLVDMIEKWEDENIVIDPPTKEESALFREEQEMVKCPVCYGKGKVVLRNPVSERGFDPNSADSVNYARYAPSDGIVKCSVCDGKGLVKDKCVIDTTK